MTARSNSVSEPNEFLCFRQIEQLLKGKLDEDVVARAEQIFHDAAERGIWKFPPLGPLSCSYQTWSNVTTTYKEKAQDLIAVAKRSITPPQVSTLSFEKVPVHKVH